MVYKFYRKETGESEEVEKVRIVWRAISTTGETLSQYEADGTFHQIKEINQKTLAKFIMEDEEIGRKYELLFPKGATLIHKYIHNLIYQDNMLKEKQTIFCFGYELNNQKTILAIYPNGNINIVDDFSKIKIM